MYLMAIVKVKNANVASGVTCSDVESSFSPLMPLVLEAHLDNGLRNIHLLGVIVRILPTTPRTSALRLSVFLLRMDLVLVRSTVCNLLLLLTTW